MASEAEVDLIISTADALPQLEQDLSRIIRVAEDNAPELDVEAALAVGASLASIAEDLEDVVRAAEDGTSDIELEAALDTQRSLTHIQGQLESIVDRASRGEEIELRAELDQVGSLTGVSNQLRTLVAAVETAAPDIELDVDVDQDSLAAAERGGLNLGRALRPLAGILGGVTAGMSAVSLAAGTLPPLLAGIATSLEAIAPAAAVATTGIAAVTLAAGATKIALLGVADAVKLAFDPAASPDELAKALEGLAPEARKFVVELRSLKGELGDIKEAVQQNFFVGFDNALKNLAATVLPQVSTALQRTAVTLNTMALGAADAAVVLAQDGTLGRALSSANAGLENLSKTPGQAVTAFGQLAAAAGPAFERITAAAATAFTGVTDRLSAAFESGALEDAIDRAVDTVAQLGDIAGNVFGGLGNIISGVSVEGNGLFTTLEKVTQAFEDVTASEGFQDALRALTQTANVLVDTALPLITTALTALGPVFESLAGPVQILIQALGPALTRIVQALAPVLVAAGQAFGQLVIAVTPFIDLAADLIAAVLPGLIPLFDAVGQALNAMVPFVETLATTLSAALVPVFTQIATEVLPQLLPPFVELSTKILPLLTDILIQLAPSIVSLAATFGQLLVAITPLLVELALLTAEFLDKLLPAVQPVIDIVLKLVNLALKVLAAQITGLIIPTINILVALLRGDFSGAWNQAGDLVRNIARKITEVIDVMVGDVADKIRELAQKAIARFLELNEGAIRHVLALGNKLRDFFTALPGNILGWLGDLGNLLVGVGSDIVQGLIDGLTGKLARLREIASEIASTVSGTVKDALGISSPSKVMREVGHDTMDGAILGIQDRLPDLTDQLRGVATMMPSFALPDGQTLRLPNFQQSAPMVNVYIGNEQIDARIDTRVAVANINRDRIAMQGVRR